MLDLETQWQNAREAPSGYMAASPIRLTGRAANPAFSKCKIGYDSCGKISGKESITAINALFLTSKNPSIF